MNPRAVVLARQREHLVRRSGRLRQQIATELHTLQPALSWADRLVDVWQWLRVHPLVAVAGGLGVAVSRPQRWVGLGLRVWSAWKLVRRLRGATGAASRRRAL